VTHNRAIGMMRSNRISGSDRTFAGDQTPTTSSSLVHGRPRDFQVRHRKGTTINIRLPEADVQTYKCVAFRRQRYAFSRDECKKPACGGDAPAPSAPERGQISSYTASLRFSLRWRGIRCRCLLPGNATQGGDLRTSSSGRTSQSRETRRRDLGASRATESVPAHRGPA
jgi:hypothetical protein